MARWRARRCATFTLYRNNRNHMTQYRPSIPLGDVGSSSLASLVRDARSARSIQPSTWRTPARNFAGSSAARHTASGSRRTAE